jgi:hypothetical protein
MRVPASGERRAKTAQTRRLVTRLQELGYAVEITALPASAGPVSF